VDYKHTPPNPHALQPKQTWHTESHTDYFISPRKFARYVVNQGKNFTYAENF
jgi:hypothetical protein